jgi:N-methylhydantoinase A
LGRINQDYFCGGDIEADMTAVNRALDKIAKQLKVSRQEAARGIVRIANHNMISALKLVSLNRGHDPREFTLVAFGGGGAMHADALAAELGIRKVVIPKAADVFSAWGMLMSDLRRDYFVTRLLSLKKDNAKHIQSLLKEVCDAALEQFKQENITSKQIKFLRYGKFRYENQEHSVEILLPDGTINAKAIAKIAEDFHQAYEREYTYRLDAPVEFVGTHIVAIASIGKLKPVKMPVTGRTLAKAKKGQRKVDFALDGIHTATIYDGDLLGPGMKFNGPAIIETSGTTMVIHPANAVSIDDYGNVHIRIGEKKGRA